MSLILWNHKELQALNSYCDVQKKKKSFAQLVESLPTLRSWGPWGSLHYYSAGQRPDTKEKTT